MKTGCYHQDCSSDPKAHAFPPYLETQSTAGFGVKNSGIYNSFTG